MKRILYIDESGTGGAGKCLSEIVDHFSEKGYVLVVISGDDGPWVEGYRRRGAKCFVHKLSTICSITHSSHLSLRKILDFLFNFIPNIFFIRKIIREEKIDIVHLNSSILITSGIAAFLAKTKIVWHVREIILNTFVGRLQSRMIGRLADRIIVISKEVGKSFFGTKVHLIYDGVNFVQLKVDEGLQGLVDQYKKDGHKIFLHLGQLFPEKGSFVFIDAAKLLTDKGHDLLFLVLGGSDSSHSLCSQIKQIVKQMAGLPYGTWSDRLQRYAFQQGIANRIIFTGFRRDVGNFITLSEAVVSPHYVAEPFGLTLIEAGALRRPIISTTIPPTDEIVCANKTGLLVQPKNPQALAQAMEYILLHPQEAKQMGEQGYQWVKEYFDIKITHAKIAQIYDTI